MRFRTAGILSVILVGGMFVMPMLMEHVALGYMAQGAKTIPSYTRFFFAVGVFCASFKLLLALPTVAILFTIAIFSSQSHQRS